MFKFNRDYIFRITIRWISKKTRIHSFLEPSYELMMRRGRGQIEWRIGRVQASEHPGTLFYWRLTDFLTVTGCHERHSLKWPLELTHSASKLMAIWLARDRSHYAGAGFKWMVASAAAASAPASLPPPLIQLDTIKANQYQTRRSLQ